MNGKNNAKITNKSMDEVGAENLETLTKILLRVVKENENKSKTELKRQIKDIIIGGKK